jgi:Spy/CpxP family protein refolding chaperone
VKNLKVILAVVVIFGAGMVTGALLTRAGVRPAATIQPPPAAVPGGPPGSGMWGISRAQFVQRMHRQLELSKDQCAQVDKIMKESHDRMAKLWEPIAPQAREESKHVREEIMGVLTPEQRPKFDEVFKKKNRDKAEKGETNSTAKPAVKECCVSEFGQACQP